MEPGDVLGRYEVCSLIAQGGMAEVWLAISRGVGGFKKKVVLKTILPHLSENPDFTRMFINEALLAARLNHPHIVQIFDLGSIKNHYYIAMEHVLGRSIRQVSRRCRRNGQRIPPWFVLRVMTTVCEAIQYAHDLADDSGNQLGLIHRDVTPENIMISFMGSTKVLDFGVAKATSAASATKAGTLKGKYSYISPEQIRGLAADRRSDIYSMGVILYEMLTGTRPFKGANDLALLRAVVNGNPTPPREISPWLPERLEAIILKALAADPDQRYSEAGELGEDLISFLDLVQDRHNQRELSLYISALFPDEPNIPSDVLRRLSSRSSEIPTGVKNSEAVIPTPVQQMSKIDLEVISENPAPSEKPKERTGEQDETTEYRRNDASTFAVTGLDGKDILNENLLPPPANKGLAPLPAVDTREEILNGEELDLDESQDVDTTRQELAPDGSLREKESWIDKIKAIRSGPDASKPAGRKAPRPLAAAGKKRARKKPAEPAKKPQASIKAAPITPPPGKAEPGKAAPRKAAPGKAAPGKAAPKKAAPEKAVPRKAAAKKAAAKKAAAKKAAAKKAAPKKAAPKIVVSMEPVTSKPPLQKAAPGKPTVQRPEKPKVDKKPGVDKRKIVATLAPATMPARVAVKPRAQKKKTASGEAASGHEASVSEEISVSSTSPGLGKSGAIPDPIVHDLLEQVSAVKPAAAKTPKMASLAGATTPPAVTKRSPAAALPAPEAAAEKPPGEPPASIPESPSSAPPPGGPAEEQDKLALLWESSIIRSRTLTAAPEPDPAGDSPPTAAPKTGSDRMAALWEGAAAAAARGEAPDEHAEPAAEGAPEPPEENVSIWDHFSASSQINQEELAADEDSSGETPDQSSSPGIPTGVGQAPDEAAAPDVFHVRRPFTDDGDEDIFTSFKTIQVKDLDMNQPSFQSSFPGVYNPRDEEPRQPPQRRSSRIEGPGDEAAQNFESGLSEMKRGDYDAALVHWEAALSLDPDNRVYRSNLNLLKKLMEGDET